MIILDKKLYLKKSWKLFISLMSNSREAIHLARLLSLTSLKEWCLGRISLHSLAGDHKEAQALTEEHMEMLKNIDPRGTLWMETKAE